jgi:hypothetical protein
MKLMKQQKNTMMVFCGNLLTSVLLSIYLFSLRLRTVTGLEARQVS